MYSKRKKKISWKSISRLLFLHTSHPRPCPSEWITAITRTIKMKIRSSSKSNSVSPITNISTSTKMYTLADVRLIRLFEILNPPPPLSNNFTSKAARISSNHSDFRMPTIGAGTQSLRSIQAEKSQHCSAQTFNGILLS